MILLFNILFKVILIIGVCGACRKQELKNLQIKDIRDVGDILIIEIPDSKTKISRSFVINGTFYQICKQYMQHRQQVQNLDTNQFFINYQKGKCTKQVVGINKIGNVPKQIAQYLNLPNPNLYTGHCLRRTSATILIDAGGDLFALKRHGGWKSSTTAEGYVDNSLNNKTLTAHKIIQSIEKTDFPPSTSEINENISTYNILQTINNSNQIESNSSAPSTSSLSVPSTSYKIPQNTNEPIIIQNCQNFTVNYYSKNQ